MAKFGIFENIGLRSTIFHINGIQWNILQWCFRANKSQIIPSAVDIGKYTVKKTSEPSSYLCLLTWRLLQTTNRKKRFSGFHISKRHWEYVYGQGCTLSAWCSIYMKTTLGSKCFYLSNYQTNEIRSRYIELVIAGFETDCNWEALATRTSTYHIAIWQGDARCLGRATMKRQKCGLEWICLEPVEVDPSLATCWYRKPAKRNCVLLLSWNIPRFQTLSLVSIQQTRAILNQWRDQGPRTWLICIG
jgi:hypothetical protein